MGDIYNSPFNKFMGRYELVTGKTKKKGFKPPGDDIADDIRNHKDAYNSGTLQSAQTSIRGTTLMIRGPNGFQVSIPTRFVSFHSHTGETNEVELHLKLGPYVARQLMEDIQASQRNPNEELRLRDVEDPTRHIRLQEYRAALLRLPGRSDWPELPDIL